MVLHFGIAVAASPILATVAVDGIVVVVYAAGVIAALLAAVRGVHLLRVVHGGDGCPRCRQRPDRRISTQFVNRLDRDSCCRHSIHWSTRIVRPLVPILILAFSFTFQIVCSFLTGSCSVFPERGSSLLVDFACLVLV